MIAEIAESLAALYAEVSKCLKPLAIILKQTYYMYCTKFKQTRDIKRSFSNSEQLLEWTSLYPDNPKIRKSSSKSALASMSLAKQDTHGSKLLFCISWGQLDVVYYELLKLKDIIMGDHYKILLTCLSQTLTETRLLYYKRHKKVILQKKNLHGNT